MKYPDPKLDELTMWFRCDFIGKTVWVNERLKAFLKLEAELHSFEKWELLIHPDDIELSKRLLQRHLDGEDNAFDALFRVKTDSNQFTLIHCLGRVTEKDEGNTAEVLVGVISSSAHFEQHKTSEQLQGAIDELDTFFYRASHDLRAPVLAIEGVYNLLKSQNQISGNPMLALLGTQITKIKALNSDIVSVGEIRAKVPEPEEVIMEQLVSKVISNGTQDKVSFQTEGLSNLIVFTDRVLLKSIIEGLISNGINYRDPKKQSCVVEVIAELNSPNPSLTIRDNGIGIREDLQHKVFDMFSRVSDKSLGSGLGLYKVSLACKKLNIRLTLKSEEFVGTEVKLEF